MRTLRVRRRERRGLLRGALRRRVGTARRYGGFPATARGGAGGVVPGEPKP
ncbi:hypothetical protein [Pseudonocardia sp. ICBG601]|uniref:hypothetical protein n=1 Tax=Pseudonocardia sp. ICBG601 TaxID=2846759 RepID=UPI001CF64BEC|nr:hypothetical protein [Pseudonocardia sp. ICBG601]